jgi:hypothetical protein
MNTLNQIAVIAPPGSGQATGITNPILANLITSFGGSGASFFGGLIAAAITGGIIVGAIIFFFMLLIGAIQWITSGGDKAAVEGARGRITHAVLGLIILLGIFAILALISTFFSVNLLYFDLSSLQIGG